MKLSSDTRADANVVVGYSAREVRLRERTLARSAIVTVDRVVDWPGAAFDTLRPQALDAVLALQPALIVLASGARQRFPPPEVYAHVYGRGVGLEVMEIGAACRTYNLLLAEDRRVALALLFD